MGGALLRCWFAMCSTWLHCQIQSACLCVCVCQVDVGLNVPKKKSAFQSVKANLKRQEKAVKEESCMSSYRVCSAERNFILY